MPLWGQQLPLGIQYSPLAAIQIFNDQIRSQGELLLGQFKEIFALCLHMHTIFPGVQIPPQHRCHIAFKHALHGKEECQCGFFTRKGGKALPLQKYLAQLQKSLVVCHGAGLPTALKILLHILGHRNLFHDGYLVH